MFGKLLNKIGYWLIRDDMNSVQPAEDIRYRSASIGSAVKSRSSHEFGVNGMNFTIFPATGGKVVQFSTYDPTRDRHDTRLYIITEKDELGEELAQIITRESLTR